MNNATGYLSLASRAGKIIFGADECEKAIIKGKGKLLILASDAAQNAVKRAEAMSACGKPPLLRSSFTKSDLAAATGRGNSVALALVMDEGLAAAFAAAAANGMEQEERE